MLSRRSAYSEYKDPNNVKVKENFKGPQVELVKGNIVVKESSLTVVPETSIEDYEEIVEGLHPTAKYSSFSDVNTIFEVIKASILPSGLSLGPMQQNHLPFE
jgi:hypothetical protein